MKRIFLPLLLALACAPAALAQDPVAADPSHYNVVFEDERVRVLKVTLGPRERASRHRHPASTVVYLRSVKATSPLPYTAFATREVEAGASYQMKAEEHWPDNSSDQTFEALIIEVRKEVVIKGEAKPGQVESICRDDLPPSGWVIVDVKTRFTECGGGFDNMSEIKNTKGLPAETELEVCKSSPVPEGWEVTGTTTDFTRCGRGQSFDNVKKIKRGG